MVEMNETANILNNCTANSRIVLDEIGRAQVPMMVKYSVVSGGAFMEGNIRPKTLFATHYHELTRLSGFFRDYNLQWR